MAPGGSHPQGGSHPPAHGGVGGGGGGGGAAHRMPAGNADFIRMGNSILADLSLPAAHDDHKAAKVILATVSADCAKFFDGLAAFKKGTNDKALVGRAALTTCYNYLFVKENGKKTAHEFAVSFNFHRFYAFRCFSTLKQTKLNKIVCQRLPWIAGAEESVRGRSLRQDTYHGVRPAARVDARAQDVGRRRACVLDAQAPRRRRIAVMFDVTY